MNSLCKNSLVILVSLLASFSGAKAQSITNASFETVNTGTGSGGQIWSGESTQLSTINIPGWQISRSTYTKNMDPALNNTPRFPTVYHFDNSPYGLKSAQNGNLFLSVFGGGIYEKTTTQVSGSVSGLTVGVDYNVSFWYAASVETGPTGNPYSNNPKYSVFPDWNDANWTLNVAGASMTFDALTSPTSYTRNDYPAIGVGQTHIASPWKQASVTFTAGNTTELLNFVGIMQGGPSQLLLDNISIMLTPVPEPSGALLVSLAGLLGIMRRKRH